jgi:predicted RecA/RadA family phage recombinase
MGNFIQHGDTIDHTPGSAVTAGTCILLGTVVGFPERDIAANTLGSLRLRGVISHAKAASQAWTVGAKVYWDDTNKVFTTTSSGNTLAGIAVEAVGSGAGETTGKVRINDVN